MFAVLAVGYWLISPLFIDVRVNEAFPSEISGEIKTLSKEVLRDDRAAFVADMNKMAMEEHVMNEAMPLTSEPRLLAVGNFESVAHRGFGTAKLFEVPGGDIYLRFENFEVLNGPDLRVFLSKSREVNSAADLGEDAFELGSLKGNKGDQNYVIDAKTAQTEIDITEYHSVIIYCKPFKVVFNSAFLDFDAEELIEFGSREQTASKADLSGGWLMVSSETLSWDSIILNEDGTYFSHLKERPFDTGTWDYSDDILELKSDAGLSMNLSFSDLTLKENKLELEQNGLQTVWNKVE